MVEAWALAQKISTVISGFALALILVGSYLKVWAWYRDLVECKAEHKAELAELRQDFKERLAEANQARARWEAIAAAATGLTKILAEAKGVE